MTAHEVCQRCNIPEKILKEYEKRDFFGKKGKFAEPYPYNDTDIECLGMIITLLDIGFSSSEAETYITLLLIGKSTEQKRLQMLNKLRSDALEEIHFKERQLEQLDYLRHNISKNKFQEDLL